MKKTQLKQKLLAGWLMLVLLGSNWAVGLAQTSHEYTVDDLTQLITDITASTYDVYILTSSGGIYDVPTPPDISVTATIKGADGIESRPVLKYTTNTSSSFGTLRIRNATERITVTLENLEFDCSSDLGNVARIDSDIELVVRNCYIHDNTNTVGVLRFNTAGAGVTFENTLVSNCKQRVIDFYTTDVVYGAANLINCTFNNIQGPVLYYRSSGTVAIGSDATVDHCTFNNITGTEGVLKFRNMQGTVTVKNSIFTSVLGTLDPTWVAADYCYVKGLETAPVATNSIETDPVYADAANNNFTLTNSDQLQGGDMQILGDLTWYDDVYPPVVYGDMKRLDDTHLQLYFNEMVNTATAEPLTNYTLSGTFGLSGNPSSLTVAADAKSVVLEVADMSPITPGQNVTVTVTGVEDLMANVIDGNNVATYTYYDDIPPVVVFAAQNATNDEGSQVLIQSNETGMAYLILESADQSGIDAFQAALASGQGASAEITTANTDIYISTAGLQPGSYYAYAVDGYDNISLRSENTATVADVTAPQVSMEAQAVTNAARAEAVSASSSEPGTIYLVLDGEASSTVADLETAVSALKGAKGLQLFGESATTISMAGVTPGTYHAYAVDLAENISSQSIEAVQVTEYVPRVRYYAAEEAATLSADVVSANDGDIFILTTSGGHYDMAYWNKISADISIMADEDLEERPVLSNYIEASTYQVFRLFAPGARLKVKGLEFDSKYNDTYPVKYMLRVASDIGNYSLVAEDCYFHGDLKATGAILKVYGGTHGDSVIFRNCIFESTEAISMTGLSTENSPSWDKLEISNCTFINIPDYAVVVTDQPSMNRDYPIDIDHCTFYNTGSAENNIIYADSMANVRVTNSIFAESPSPSVYNVFGDVAGQSEIDYYNYFNTPQPVSIGTGIAGTNVWNEDPLFEDASSGNLKLGNQNLYNLGSDGLPLGDLRWADVLGPKVLAEVKALSDTTLVLTFSEWIDTTSAEVAANYSLSGSAGLTGTVKKAEIYNFRKVVLTTESFLTQVGNEIIITVTGVEDLEGNLVDASANSATYIVEEMLPVVFASAQNVTNADGQSVVVQASLGSGFVYIILDGETQITVEDLDAAVAVKKGAKTAATAAFIDILIPVYSLVPGTYYAYLVDANGNISEKGENALIISDGIAPVVSAAIQSADNGADSYVLVRSNEDNGKVYIILDGVAQSTSADFITAVALGNGSAELVSAADTDIQVSTSGLATGIYYAYAIDAAGNISERGDSPINITEASSVGSFSGFELKVYSAEDKLVLESAGGLIQEVFVFDISGRMVQHAANNSSHFESRSLRTGVYILNVTSDQNETERLKVILR